MYICHCRRSSRQLTSLPGKDLLFQITWLFAFKIWLLLLIAQARNQVKLVFTRKSEPTVKGYSERPLGSFKSTASQGSYLTN